MMVAEYKIICLNRWLGKCPNCKEDYGQHHPNNFDCSSYQPIRVRYFYVQKNTGLDDNSIKTS